LPGLNAADSLRCLVVRIFSHTRLGPSDRVREGMRLPPLTLSGGTVPVRFVVRRVIARRLSHRARGM